MICLTLGTNDHLAFLSIKLFCNGSKDNWVHLAIDPPKAAEHQQKNRNSVEFQAIM
jgi:hypothetical protein